MVFSEAPESPRTRHDFIPEVLRDPSILVAMPPPRVRMPPTPDATTSPPTTSPVSIHSSEGGLNIGSFLPLRRLTNEFLMPEHIKRSLSPSPAGEQALSEWGFRNRIATTQGMSHQMPRQSSSLDNEDVEDLQARHTRMSSELLQSLYIPRRNTTVERFRQETASGAANNPAWRAQQPPPGYVLRYETAEGYGLRLPEENINNQSQDTDGQNEAMAEDSADGSGEEIELDWRTPVRRAVRSQSLSAIERRTSPTREALAARRTIWQPFYHEV